MKHSTLCCTKLCPDGASGPYWVVLEEPVAYIGYFGVRVCVVPLREPPAASGCRTSHVSLPRPSPSPRGVSCCNSHVIHMTAAGHTVKLCAYGVIHAPLSVHVVYDRYVGGVPPLLPAYPLGMLKM